MPAWALPLALLICLARTAESSSAWDNDPYTGHERRLGETARHVDGRAGTPWSRLRWKSLTQRGDVIGQPALATDGNIVYTSVNGYLQKVKDTDGSVMWSVWLGNLKSSPTIDKDGNIFVGSSDSRMYAMTSAGVLKWRYDTPNGIVGRVLVTTDGRIVFGGRDGYLYFLNAAGGLLYKHNMMGEVLAGASELRDGAVACGSLGRSLVVINKNHTLRWSFDAQEEIAAKPLITDTAIVFTTRSGSNYGGAVISLTMEGQVKWIFNTTKSTLPTWKWSSSESPVFAVQDLDTDAVQGPQGQIFIGGADGKFYAIQEDGQLLWRYVTGYANSAPVICRNSIVFNSMNKYVYGISLDGAFLWKYLLDRGSRSQPLCAAVDNTDKSVKVWVGSRAQYLYALEHNF